MPHTSSSRSSHRSSSHSSSSHRTPPGNATHSAHTPAAQAKLPDQPKPAANPTPTTNPKPTAEPKYQHEEQKSSQRQRNSSDQPRTSSTHQDSNVLPAILTGWLAGSLISFSGKHLANKQAEAELALCEALARSLQEKGSKVAEIEKNPDALARHAQQTEKCFLLLQSLHSTSKASLTNALEKEVNLTKETLKRF